MHIHKSPPPKKMQVEGLTVLEVYHSHKISDYKLMRLRESSIPFVEIQADTAFYRGKSAWNFTAPLHAFESSENWVVKNDDHVTTLDHMVMIGNKSVVLPKKVGKKLSRKETNVSRTHVSSRFALIFALLLFFISFCDCVSFSLL